VLEDYGSPAQAYAQVWWRQKLRNFYWHDVAGSLRDGPYAFTAELLDKIELRGETGGEVRFDDIIVTYQD
jgi:hypothetical protein